MKQRRANGKWVALVSGGAGDIGRAIGARLLADGFKVSLGDQHAKPGRILARSGAHYQRVDITQTAEIDRWFTEVETTLGCPEVVICNAAIVELGSAVALDEAAWRRTLDVNLTGAFLLAQRAAQRWLAAGTRGRILFVGSWAAHAPHPNLAAYCVAKAGLRMAAQCLAVELAPHGILVNEVAPGQVDAGLSRRIFDSKPQLRKRALSRIPTRSLLSSEDVADAVAYLCRLETRQITGSTLLVDGGLSLVRPV